MRALVTGATGFVGSHLVETLQRAGWSVTILVRNPKKLEETGIQGVHSVVGDLASVESLTAACHDQDVVFHVAGLVAARSPGEYLDVNRDGTGRLVAAAESTGVGRLVLVSSLAAAGPSQAGAPRTEDLPTAPVTAYGRSKLAAEEVVRRSTLPWTILRPPTIYGPRDRELLTAFKAVRLGIAPVFGDGRQELSVIHVTDLAEALLASATAPGTIGLTAFVAHPEIVTSASLLHAIGASLDRTPWILPVPRFLGTLLLQVTGAAAALAGRATILNPDKANEFFQPAWTCSPTRLAEATGWRARIALAEGIPATTAWYQSSGWL